MAKSFTITTNATDALKADAQGHAQALFTVTNTTTRPMRGMARVKALENTKPEWLKLSGESERDFPPGGTQQFDVAFDAPPPAAPAPGAPAAPAQQCSFRLDVASATEPRRRLHREPDCYRSGSTGDDRAYAENKKPWLWIIIAIVTVRLIGGIILFFSSSDRVVNLSPRQRQRQLQLRVRLQLQLRLLNRHQWPLPRPYRLPRYQPK